MKTSIALPLLLAAAFPLAAAAGEGATNTGGNASTQEGVSTLPDQGPKTQYLFDDDRAKARGEIQANPSAPVRESADSSKAGGSARVDRSDKRGPPGSVARGSPDKPSK